MRMNKIQQYLGLMAALAMPACTSVTRKDLWKPEKEFTQTIPTGESDASRLQYTIDARQQGQSIELLVKDTKYAERFQHFQVVENVREKKYVEETGTKVVDYDAHVTGLVALIGSIGLMSWGIYTLATTKEGDSQMTSGVFATLFGSIGIFPFAILAYKPSNFKTSALVHPTDELRIAPRGQREMKNRTKQEQVYASRPAAGIEVIAESDFYRLNGSRGRASVLTSADGKAYFALELPPGYVKSERQLLDVLMPYAESGAMSLDEVKRAVAGGTEKHTIQFKTNVPATPQTIIDEAAADMTLTTYKLPK